MFRYFHYATVTAAVTMRRFERSLIQEFVSKTLAALLIISAISLVLTLARFLGMAAVGSITDAGILPMAMFRFLRLLPVIVSLALFLGIFITLIRQIQEHEQEIWSGAGLSPKAWLRPILFVAVPTTLIVAILSLFLLPWSAQKRSEYEHGQEAQKSLAFLTPGLFTEISKSGRIFFVEQPSAKHPGEDTKRVFIHEDRPSGATRVTLARRGYVETHADGTSLMVLEQGRSYELDAQKPGYTLTEFNRYLSRQHTSPMDTFNVPSSELGMRELLSDPTPPHLQEFVWRMGLPISAVILALLALPLSRFNPRAGRSLHILFAILVYALYDNSLIISSAWVGAGKMSVPASLIFVHGSALLVFWLLFLTRVDRRFRLSLKWARR